MFFNISPIKSGKHKPSAWAFISISAQNRHDEFVDYAHSSIINRVDNVM